jgi:hypothetical protein
LQTDGSASLPIFINSVNIQEVYRDLHVVGKEMGIASLLCADGQLFAVVENICADTDHRAGEGQGVQTLTEAEGIIPDGIDTGGDGLLLQSTATGKSIVTDACHALRQENMLQSGTAVKD